MTDLNSQANRGGSNGGSKAQERKEPTPEQKAYKRVVREAIEAHQHKDDEGE